MRRKVCGVYLLRCIATGFVYVGSSKDVETRRRDHISRLNRRAHANPRLQRAWDKYGAAAFVFEIAAEVSPADLLRFEQLFIDGVFKAGLAFNGNRHAHTRLPFSRNVERENLRKFATVTHAAWATLSNVAIAKRLDVAVATAATHRPAGIPSPGSSREYLSASTRAALHQRKTAGIR